MMMPLSAECILLEVKSGRSPVQIPSFSLVKPARLSISPNTDFTMPLDKLTFGVELEFICIRPDGLFNHDVYSDDPDVGNEAPTAGPFIWHCLNQNGIPAVGWEDPDTEDEVEWPSHSRWRVESDCLKLSEEEYAQLDWDWSVEEIELSSRKFDFHRDDWRGEIQAVLDVLRAIEARGCRFVTNNSTGMHVHVGNDKYPIPLPCAKNVFQFATAFESLLDQLHPITRTDIPADLSEGRNTLPPCYFHMLSSNIFDAHIPGESPALFHRLANIETAVTYKDLGSFFTVDRSRWNSPIPTTGHNSAYNFDNLFPDHSAGRYAETLTGTIEFRQHAGSLDFLEITAWICLVCRIVDFCSTVDSEDMIKLCLHAVEPDYALDDLLNDIFCPIDLIEHFTEESHLIGFLPRRGMPALPEMEEALAVMEQNEFEQEQRHGAKSVKAFIDYKSFSGFYGLDPAVHEKFLASIRETTVRAELDRAEETLEACVNGLDVSSEYGQSRVRHHVYKRLARLYGLDNTNHRLPKGFGAPRS